MLAKVNSCMVVGVEGLTLDIEVDISRGLPVFSTVGLADGAVRESKDRVKAAIKNSGYEFPNRRITINLAPANLRKEGAGYDLPIALGILSANGLISEEKLESYSIIGELSLDGSVRGVRGVLPMVLHAKEKKQKGVIIPFDNLLEASVISDLEIIPVLNLFEAVEFLTLDKKVNIKTSLYQQEESDSIQQIDFADVKGHDYAKRAMEIAASGNHNILMQGPPGAGKTMLAKRLTTILPELSFDEAIEATKIHSIAGTLPGNISILRKRPFRSPHHTISDAGLIGGGSFPKPGEISLATNGVLFLDELTEFKKRVLEMLRQPLEDGEVTISRANMSLSFPSRFILVGAYNPCPCGFLGDRRNRCDCTPAQIQKYKAKLSGPLLDRFDIHLEIAALNYEEMTGFKRFNESSGQIKERVEKARAIQKKRFKKEKGFITNSIMSTKMIESYCKLDQESEELLKLSIEKLGLSTRGYHKILKIARTIADLDVAEKIKKKHLSEAINLRRA